MFRLSLVAFLGLFWALLFYGALSIAKLNFGVIKELCGSWGCLPNSAPLLSVHAMWLVLIAGLSLLAVKVVQPLQTAFFWRLFAFVAFAALCLKLVFDFAAFTQVGGELHGTGEVLKFLAFQTLRSTDLPLAQFCVVSLLLGQLLCSRSRLLGRILKTPRALASDSTDVV